MRRRSRRVRTPAAAKRSAAAATSVRRAGRRPRPARSPRPPPARRPRPARPPRARVTASIAPAGVRRHQLAAPGDQPERVRQRQHPGQAGGRVLADAVPEQRRRPQAPADQLPGQRVPDHEERGLPEPGRSLARPQWTCRAAARRPPGRAGRRHSSTDPRGTRAAPRTPRPPSRRTARPGRGRGSRPVGGPRHLADRAPRPSRSASVAAPSPPRPPGGRPAGCGRSAACTPRPAAPGRPRRRGRPAGPPAGAAPPAVRPRLHHQQPAGPARPARRRAGLLEHDVRVGAAHAEGADAARRGAPGRPATAQRGR